MKKLIVIIFFFSTSLIFAQNKKNLEKDAIEAKENILSIFEKAHDESISSRDYCKKIHSNSQFNKLLNMEECAATERLDIYKKYKIYYTETRNILFREYEELYALAKSFEIDLIMGTTNARRQKYLDAVYAVRIRTSDKLTEEAHSMADLAFKSALKGKDKTDGDVASKDKPKNNTIKSGSAFFVNNKGNIITNNHVVERCGGPIKVLYNKKEFSAKVLSKDGNLDLAVLSSDVKPNQYLKLSKKSGDKLDKVVAAGYPLGYKISDELKLTAGIVSATKGWKDNINEFQIDAALNPGNSGGPVVNDAGNLFGVAVAGLADRQNLNFAIKSKAVKDFLDINKVSYSTATVEFDMDNKKRLKLLEDSTIFIYCN